MKTTHGPCVGATACRRCRRRRARPCDVELHARGPLRGLQRRLQVGDQVVRVLQADRQPDRARPDAGGGERRVVHAEVRRRRRMDHQRAAVADVGQVREQLQRLDEGDALRARAAQVEAEDRAAAARQQRLARARGRDATRARDSRRCATIGCAARNATTLRALATWRSMRSGSVSRPCRISQAVCGLMQAPKSRRPSRRARSRKAPTVLSSVNTMSWKPA